MKTIKLKGYKDFELVCYLWDKVENPKGVFQIIHGMQEHAKRYDDFAKYLNKKGFIVFASDLRGHGETALLHNLPQGYSDGDIFMETVYDQMRITDYLLETYKLPISVLGHSYGSFIAQRYVLEYGFKIKNLMLSGSTYTNSFAFKSGHIVACLNKLLGRKKKTAKLIENISIKAYGKGFANGNWLSRDESVWEDYQKDEFCGKPFPNNFYWSLFKNGRKNYKNLKNIPYYLPILIMSGTSDPVAGKRGNGVISLFFKYGKARKRVFFKSYLDARHEILNETCKDNVYDNISEFALSDNIPHINYNM